MTVIHNRYEELVFKFETVEFEKLTAEEKCQIVKYYKVRTDLTAPKCVNGDALNLTYSIDITYYGSVIEALKCVEVLLDNNRIVNVSTEELKYGKCLIQDVLNKIESIEKRLKEM